MIRFSRLAALFTLIVAALPSGASAQTKSPGIADGANPFDAKMRAHHRLAEPGPAYTALQNELGTLSEKLQAARAQLHARVVPANVAVRARELERLEAISEGTLQVHWDAKVGVPRFINGRQLQPVSLGKRSAASEASLVEQSMAFLTTQARLLQVSNPQEEFELLRVEHDSYGFKHIRFQQKFHGLEVWGRDVILHINEAGLVDAFNGRYIPSPHSVVFFEERVSESEALEKELALVGANHRELRARKLIWPEEDGSPRLAWMVTSRVGHSEHWQHFVDAQTGETLLRYNEVAYDGPVQGVGVDLQGQSRQLSLYLLDGQNYLIDTSKPMYDAANSVFPGKAKGVIYVYSANHGDGTSLFYVRSPDPNDWTGGAHAVSAAANGALVYDYFKQVHGRDAIDGKGETMSIIVDYLTNENNAMWDGEFMIFGNGDGSTFSDLSAALDVTGHEMTHGVDQFASNLIYQDQSGALDESFADVFGALLEFWVEGQAGDWIIAEDVITPGTPGDGLRDMENPSTGRVAPHRRQPAHMTEFEHTSRDNGGVHINSGIPNRAFYLFASSVGLADAEKVYYRTFTQYLTRRSEFVDARLGVIKSAEDIFGVGSSQAIAAGQAFDAVGIEGATPTPPPPALPPVAGNEFLAVVDPINGGLFRYNVGSGDLLGPLNQFLSFKRPAVTDNGQFLIYVDFTNNLRIVATDGSGDLPLTDTGLFSNAAISPDGRYLAATSTFIEDKIHVIDLNEQNGQFVAFDLYNPTTAEGVKTENVLFPDRLDWASDSQTLMYDAYNIFVDSFGDTTGYWNVNVLRVPDGNIQSLLPPQPPDVNIGNPVFASNNDNVIAIDFIDPQGQVRILTIDTYTGAQGLVSVNFSSLGSPTFSRDDDRIYYQFVNTDGSASIWYANLLADGLTGDGNDQRIVTGGTLPVNFAMGERAPTSVETAAGPIPSTFGLEQNFPNPFNPETAIRYTLPENSAIRLGIFDLIGRSVIEIDAGTRAAGTYTVRWNGQDATGRSVSSGIYFYRLEATTSTGARRVFTRKLTILQ